MLFYKSIKLHLCVMILIVYHCSTSVDGGKHGPEFIQKLCDGGDDEIEELAQVMQCEKKVLVSSVNLYLSLFVTFSNSNSRKSRRLISDA